MGYLFHLAMAIFFFSLSACGSTHKKTVKTAPSDQPVAARKDTIPKPPPPSSGLPPTTNRIKGKVLSVHADKNNNGGTIKLEVLQFLGTGSSTPAISPHDTLIVKISTLPDSLQEGSEFTGILTYRQVLAKFEKTSPRWILVGIEKK